MKSSDIKTGTISEVDDSGNFRFGVSTFWEKAQKINVFTPYGFMNCPVDGSLGLLFSVQGKENITFAVVDDPKNRVVKNLEQGEVAVGNYVTKDYMVFNKDSDTIIHSESGSETILRSNGDIVLKPASGKVIIEGDIEMTGVIKGVNVFNTGAQSNTHIHPQGNDSDGDAEQDTGVAK